MKKNVMFSMFIAFGCAQAAVPLDFKELGVRRRDFSIENDTASTFSQRSVIGECCGCSEDCDESMQRVLCNGCGLCDKMSRCTVICCQPKAQAYVDLDDQTQG